MNDLRLWKLLRQGDLEAVEAVPLLQELAALSLPERVPFFGVLSPALNHTDPLVRAAAVTCLRQAGGVLGYKQLVRALHDPEALVRLAATDALREAAVHDPARWVHALFHPDAEVRRHAACAF
jgi:HEAT repeat protein